MALVDPSRFAIDLGLLMAAIVRLVLKGFVVLLLALIACCGIAFVITQRGDRE